MFVAYFVVLGCPRSGSSTLEPRVVYRADVHDFALKLLGEVNQFASFGLVAGLLECQCKRSVLEDMLTLNFASYGWAAVVAPSGALSVFCHASADNVDAAAAAPDQLLQAVRLFGAFVTTPLCTAARPGSSSSPEQLPALVSSLFQEVGRK